MRQLSSNKKGDITITTIIVAALGLLVLIVLIAVFTGRFAVFTQGVTGVQQGEASCKNLCVAQGYGDEFILRSGCLSSEEDVGKGFVSSSGEKEQNCCCQ